MRTLVREVTVEASDLILPLFAVPGSGVRRPVPSMPGVEQTSVDELVRDAAEAQRLGLGGVLLFGIPEAKDEVGSGAYDTDGVVQRAVRRIKAEVPELLVITDVCLCEYTSHGHCGILSNGDVDNDATLPLLARTALSHAEAGADVVAPSDMMDGRVGAIRAAMDDHGLTSTAILSYAVKYASAFYGPFRDAAESAPAEGDRRSAQDRETRPRSVAGRQGLNAILQLSIPSSMLCVESVDPRVQGHSTSKALACAFCSPP